MPNYSKRGAILFIVLGVVIVASVLATVILRIISNQSRLTHHQGTRIQAQYAAKAGVLYALDKLRRNDAPACWPPAGPFPYTRIMRSVTGPPPPCVIDEDDLPSSVSQIEITVDAPGTGVSGTQKVSAKAIYTYSP